MDKFTILGCDLGKNFGWCRCVCKITPEVHVDVIDHGTIYLDDLTSIWFKNNYNEFMSRQRIRMNIFNEQVHQLVNRYNFDCYAAEDIFCVPQRIDAFRNLTLYTDVLESIVNNEKHKRLFKVTPTQVKKHISDFGHADKTRVMEFILNNPHIRVKNPIGATEHEFDSIGVVWGFIHEYILTLV